MSIRKSPFLAISFAALVFLLGASSLRLASAQDDQSTKSLADLAKEAKKNKTGQAKKVVTDEDMVAHHGPLPALNMDGTDNSEEIIAAIGVYNSKHPKEETEQVIHDWYDEYDTLLGAAIRDNNETRDHREATNYSGYQLCLQSKNHNYKECEERRQAEMRGARHDQLLMRDNGLLSARIQQAFMKIRGGIGAFGLHYTWFKVRNGNGNGSF